MKINIILILVLLFSIYYNQCNGKACTCRVSTQAECESAGYLKYDADGNVERQCTWEASHHRCRNTIWLECMKDESCIWINKVTDEDQSKQPIDRIGNPCGYDQQDDEEYAEQTDEQADIDIPNNDDAYQNEDDEADQTDENNVEYPGDENNVEDPGDQDNAGYSDGGDQNNGEYPGDQENIGYPSDQSNAGYPGGQDNDGDQNNVEYPGDQDNVDPGDEDAKTGDDHDTFWGESTDDNNDGNQQQGEEITMVSNEEKNQEISSVYASDGSDGINREENAAVMMSSIENRSSNIRIFALLIVIIGGISGGIYHFVGKTKKGEKIKLLKEHESGNYETIVAMDQHRSYSTF